jgi:hypothetical protein
MTGAELREKRQRFGLSQSELAKILDVSRSTIVGLETSSELPSGIAFTFEYFVERRWWQRAEVGPVTLVYADGPMFIGGGNYRVPQLRLEPCANNAAAIDLACRLYEQGGFFNPFVTIEGGQRVVFDAMELASAFERRRAGEAPLPAWPPERSFYGP